MKKRMQEGLLGEAIDNNANAQAWRTCEAKAPTREEWEKEHAAYLIDLACSGALHQSQEYVTEGIYSSWIQRASDDKSPIVPQAWALARGLIGLDKPCPGAKELGEEAIEELKDEVQKGSGNQ